MFRDMRRKKQRLSDEETIAILESGKSGVLGLIGDEGYPYTIPMSYTYADGKIYLHGSKTGHKIDAIKSCDKVSFCIVTKDDVVPEKLTTYYRSVIAFGRARILETENEIFEAAKKIGLKYYPNTEAVEAEVKHEFPALCCIEINIEHMTGKESIELVRMRKENI